MNPRTLAVRQAAAFALACTALAAGIRAEPARPNVLLLFIDDLRPELGAYGAVRALTPHLDHFAADSVVFDRAYCQYTVCAPSRSSLLTGLAPDQLGIYGNEARLRARHPDLVTLPQTFRNAGYEAVSVGKVFDRRVRDPQSWDKEYLFGEDPLYAHRENRLRYEENDRKNKADKTYPWKVGPAVEIGRDDREPYEDEKIAAKAREELARLATAAKPFLLAVGLHKPHLPFTAPEQYWKLYDRAAIRLPAADKVPEGSPAVAFWNWLELRAYEPIPQDGPLDADTARELIHGYLAATSFADAMAGTILDDLDKLKLAEKTIVVLLGDHGYHLGELGQWCKYVNTELAARTPLMMRGPGLPPARVDAPVEFIDLYPTLAALAGMTPPSGLPGRDISPLLHGESPPGAADHAALTQVFRFGRAMGHSLRQGNYRYTRWLHPRDGSPVAEELYEYSADGIETKNLAADPSLRATRDTLAALLEKTAAARGWAIPIIGPDP